jgi:hypothetical protein
MATRRRSADKVLQFESEREATTWAIIIGPIAAACEDLDEAADDADDLILAWRARRLDLDELEEEERLGAGDD